MRDLSVLGVLIPISRNSIIAGFVDTHFIIQECHLQMEVNEEDVIHTPPPPYRLLVFGIFYSLFLNITALFILCIDSVFYILVLNESHNRCDVTSILLLYAWFGIKFSSWGLKAHSTRSVTIAPQK